MVSGGPAVPAASSNGATTATPERWDTAYEWKVVVLLTLGFGLVGLDRWIIAPLLPSMAKDLHLNYQDFGNIIGALGLAWGLFAGVAGGASDRWGRRRVLIPAMLAFSLLSGFSGLATGLTTLVLIRVIMGLSEGTFCPTSFATVNDASKPSRRGFNLGFQQSTFPLFGLAFGPIIATQLLQVTSWRWIFVLVAVPGLILAGLLAMVVRDPHQLKVRPADHLGERGKVSEVLKHRNVALGMLGLLCAMCGIFTISAMVPAYLLNYVKLSGTQMGFVTSAIGFGGFAGQLILPWLSDMAGRRNVTVVSFLIGAIFIYVFAHTGNNPAILFITLFIGSFFPFGLLGLITGPIAAEAAPRGLVSFTTGIIVASGEIFGGGIAPVIAGTIAQHYGIQYTLTMAMAGLAVGFFVTLFLRETSPRMLARRGVLQPERVQA